MSLNPEWAAINKKVLRRKFLKQIGYNLTDDWIQHHMQNVRILQPRVKTALELLGKLVVHPQPAREAGHQIRKGRQLCPRGRDKKTSIGCMFVMQQICSLCSLCNRFVRYVRYATEIASADHSSQITTCVDWEQ